MNVFMQNMSNNHMRPDTSTPTAFELSQLPTGGPPKNPNPKRAASAGERGNSLKCPEREGFSRSTARGPAVPVTSLRTPPRGGGGQTAYKGEGPEGKGCNSIGCHTPWSDLGGPLGCCCGAAPASEAEEEGVTRAMQAATLQLNPASKGT